ncbi:MAG: hypothetical protein IKE95_03640 [Methanobrevibacter sp.]|nr:hypothetical protein [Methanobrevibacter sp.]
MTEKRFQWVYIQEDKVIRLNDNGIVKHFPPQRLEELLNELNDENEQLKQQLAYVDRLIDEKIEEYLNIPSLSDGALIALKELKKEYDKGDV